MAEPVNALATNALPGLELAPSGPETLELQGQLHEWTKQFEQVSLDTEHVIHGGMYARTIRLEPQTLMNGSLIKLATLLIVQGSCLMVAGDGVVEIDGYNVFAGCAGRKQSFYTRGPVVMTMIAPTKARTVEEAENEIFAEADELMSRKEGNGNCVTVTEE